MKIDLNIDPESISEMAWVWERGGYLCVSYTLCDVRGKFTVG